MHRFKPSTNHVLCATPAAQVSALPLPLASAGYLSDLQVAASVPDLDIIVGAHSHTFLWGTDGTERGPLLSECCTCTCTYALDCKSKCQMHSAACPSLGTWRP